MGCLGWGHHWLIKGWRLRKAVEGPSHTSDIGLTLTWDAMWKSCGEILSEVTQHCPTWRPHLVSSTWQAFKFGVAPWMRELLTSYPQQKTTVLILSFVPSQPKTLSRSLVTNCHFWLRAQLRRTESWFPGVCAGEPLFGRWGEAFLNKLFHLCL